MAGEVFCPESKKHKPELACKFRHFCDGTWKACRYWLSGCTHPERNSVRRRKER
jgi:hypothetical protein